MNINVKLTKNFTTQLNKLKEKYGEEFEYLNGIGDNQLNYTGFIDNFIDKDVVADSSVDSNANVSTQSMATLLREMSKPAQILLCLHKLYYEMQKKYGFAEANKWLELQYNKTLYMHDLPTATFTSYCFAYDLKNVAEKGLHFLNQHNAEPPKHLTTFVRFVTEHTAFHSNLTSGACGYPNLIPYMYYFWKKDIENGYYLKDPETYAKQNIQELIYQWNQPICRDGSQSSFTNVTLFDHPYLEALFGGAEFPDGTFMVDELEGIMDFQKLFLLVATDIRGKNVMTFPVLTISCLRKNDEFVDEDFAKWALEVDRKWMLCNWFGDTSVNSLSNCCRLRSNIEDIKEKWDGAYFNSIGGTALKVGSCKVSTINLARIALESKDQNEFLEKLREIERINLHVLDVQRTIIKRNVEKQLLPNFTSGEIDFEHLYSTTGILSPYETLKTFGLIKQDEFGNTFYTKEADEFTKKIFNVLHEEINSFTADKDYMGNLEACPGETAAIKFQKADTLLYPDKVVKDLPLYGNQYIPLGIKATLQERIRVAGLYTKFCNGGDILHCNIDAPFDTFDKAWHMLNYIFKQGVTYFAFTTKIRACAHNHGFYGDYCPICGEHWATEYARVVGFWTNVNNWSENRKEEYTKREWMELNQKGENG